MLTNIDEKQGVVQVSWCDVRDRVAFVAPRFADLVDALNPDDSFTLFLVYYPFGALKGDTQNSYLPNGRGGYYRLSDADAPKELIKHLGYGIGGSPMGMVLEKQFEYFIDLKHKGITIPWLMYYPGQFFPFSTVFNRPDEPIYAPNGLLSVSAGARSTFMLPNIGCNTHHANLKRDFNIKQQAPKTLYDHWFLFRDIVHHHSSTADWQACLLYFGEKWLVKLRDDAAFMPLKLYLHEMAWRRFEYERNRVYYDIAFSLIQEKRNLKPNPYLVDTAKHLFTIALGVMPGYTPACYEEALPLRAIQQAFIDSYGMKKYVATIMQPAHFDYGGVSSPVYYSLQHPSTHVFSPKSRNVSSTIADMIELEYIVRIFSEELAHADNLCADTIIGTVANNIRFQYFHNKHDRQQVVSPSSAIPLKDARYAVTPHHSQAHSAVFAADAPFVRGCVGIGL